jgi:hypothetical protein
MQDLGCDEFVLVCQASPKGFDQRYPLFEKPRKQDASVDAISGQLVVFTAMLPEHLDDVEWGSWVFLVDFLAEFVNACERLARDERFSGSRPRGHGRLIDKPLIAYSLTLELAFS